MTGLEVSAVAALLREFAQRSALREDNPFRTKAYARAADNLLTLTLPLDHLTGPVRSIGRSNLIPFTLKLRNLYKYELQPSEQTLNLGQCIRWDSLVEARSQFSQPAPPTLKKRIIVVDPKRRQNGADSVRETDTIGEELCPLADTSPSILIGFVWDWDHRTHAGLAAKPSKQSA
jgi:hypothetical protein